MHPEEFASQPGSPRWETPRDVASRAQADTSIGSSLLRANEVPETRALVLYRTTHELEQLCSDSVETQLMQDLLETWTLVAGPSSGKLQPNLLAWLNSSNALKSAVTNQRKDIIQVLLSYGLEPNERAISAAVAHVLDTKDTSILGLLIKGGWDINRVYNRVRPSIMRCVSYYTFGEFSLTIIVSCLVQDESLIKWCLSLGGDPNGLSPSKTTVLHRAACIGSIESLDALITAGGQIKSPSPSDDVVAYAVDSHDESNDRIATIHHLLDLGADIDAYYGQNHDYDHPSGIDIIMGKQTALHLAIGKGNQQLVEMLIERGAHSSKLMWNYSTAYSIIKKHAGDPHWREHVEWLDSIGYARFLGFVRIVKLLQNSSRI